MSNPALNRRQIRTPLQSPDALNRGSKVPAKIIKLYLRVVAAHFDTTAAKMKAYKARGGGTPGSSPIHRAIAIYLLRRDHHMHLDELAVLFDRSRTTIIRTIADMERRLAAGHRLHTDTIRQITQKLSEQAPLTKPLTNGHSQAKLRSSGPEAATDSHQDRALPATGAHGNRS